MPEFLHCDVPGCTGHRVSIVRVMEREVDGHRVNRGVGICDRTGATINVDIPCDQIEAA